jgi:hypothetical protein
VREEEEEEEERGEGGERKKEGRKKDMVAGQIAASLFKHRLFRGERLSWAQANNNQ